MKPANDYFAKRSITTDISMYFLSCVAQLLNLSKHGSIIVTFSSLRWHNKKSILLLALSESNFDLAMFNRIRVLFLHSLK